MEWIVATSIHSVLCDKHLQTLFYKHVLQTCSTNMFYKHVLQTLINNSLSQLVPTTSSTKIRHLQQQVSSDWWKQPSEKLDKTNINWGQFKSIPIFSIRNQTTTFKSSWYLQLLMDNIFIIHFIMYHLIRLAFFNLKAYSWFYFILHILVLNILSLLPPQRLTQPRNASWGITWPTEMEPSNSKNGVARYVYICVVTDEKPTDKSPPVKS